ncbi:hypothetical protein ACWDTP_12370 [Mycobacterium sp. NPDC003449]
MSRQNDAKKARRRKRQATRDARWVPEEVVQQLSDIQDAVVADLAEFDERITERGWTFDEDESGDQHAVWFYEPSGSEVDDGLPVTALWLDADDDGEIVNVTFVGTVDRYEFTHDEFFGHLDAIEAYRSGDPLPDF